MEPRKTAPTTTISSNNHQAFRVWSYSPYYDEDPKPWKCCAAFRYLQEALDYIAYCQDRGCNVVFQSPAETREILATDRRVVNNSGQVTLNRQSLKAMLCMLVFKRDDTFYLPLPEKLSEPSGKCVCKTCEAKREKDPSYESKWDCLAISENGCHSWVVHYPFTSMLEDLKAGHLEACGMENVPA